MSVVLEKEYKIYLKHLAEFAAEHLNQFVLIKDKMIVGFYDSYEKALTYGLKKFGNVPFFIKEIQEKEEVHFFHQRISTKNG